MLHRRLKPVLAGFSVLLAVNVLAQDYIDVEAEREAARRAEQAARPGQTPVQQSSTSDDLGASGDAVGNSNYSVPGIRAYSGQTATAAPTNSRVTPVVPSSSSANGVNVGSLVVQLQQLQEDVRRLNGIVEEQTEAIQRLKEQSLERYVDLDRRLASVGTGDPRSVPNSDSNADQLSFGGTAPVSPATDQQQPATPEQAGEKSAYEAAYGLVKARQFPAAVDAFQGFLGDYPFGRYAPNAHYWLGELYLVLDPSDPELARQSFKMLLDQYPDNQKVPDAIYKLGRVHFLKGNLDRSKEYLNRVIEDYKNHPAAQLAQDFIKQNF